MMNVWRKREAAQHEVNAAAGGGGCVGGDSGGGGVVECVVEIMVGDV